MATNNTVQYTITAKDVASAVFAQVAASAKGMGKSFADTFANTKEATEKMRGEVARFQSGVSTGMGLLGGDFRKFGNLLGALPGPIGVVGQAVGDTLGGIINSTVEAAEGFRKLSEKTGASVEFLSGFTQAADDVFVSAQSVNSALTIFSKKLGGAEDAMDGSGQTAGEFAKKLQEIGIRTDNVEEALLDVADRFKDMKDGTEKTALAVQLFGKQGAELIPILNKGRDGIRDMAAEAKALGLVMTNETTESVTRLKSTLDNLNDRIEGAKMNLGKPLVSILADAGDAFLKFDKQMNTSFMLAEMPGKDGTLLRTWKTFTEVNGQFVKTLSVANVAMHEFDRNLLGVGKSASEFAGVLGDWSDAWAEASARAITTSGAIVTFGGTMAEATPPTQAMKDAAIGVNGAVGEMPIKFDAAMTATLIYKLATNQLSFETFKQETATRAVTKALMDGKITTEEAAALYQGLADKSIKTEDALKRAGKAGEDAGKLIDVMNASLGRVKSKDVSLTFQAYRTPNFNDAVGTYNSQQNKTVTVTYTSNGTTSNGSPPPNPAAGDYGLPVPPGPGGGYTPPPYDDSWNTGGGNGGPYGPSGTGGEKTAKSSTFNVNNPSIIINSVSGAAIAQQIARQNMNVARRARAKAALMG